MNAAIKMTAIALVLLSLLLGILAMIVGRRAAPPAALGSVAAPPTFPVVIASRALDAGARIPSDAVRVVPYPVKPTGAFGRVEEVVGRIPRVRVAPAMPLTRRSLQQGLPLTLQPGERGVAVPIDEVVGVGNAIQPGDLVDVFLTIQAPRTSIQAAGGERMITRLLLSRLRVLAYGAASLATAPAPWANGEQRQVPHSAVLAVPMRDVDALVLATQSGHLTLAIRYPNDPLEPEPALFATAAAVLSPRPGLASDQAQRLDFPENRAFAGIDTAGLTGAMDRVPALPPLPVRTVSLSDDGARVAPSGAARRRVADGIEVIRGGRVDLELADTAMTGAKVGGGQ